MLSESPTSTRGNTGKPPRRRWVTNKNPINLVQPPTAVIGLPLNGTALFAL